MNGACHIIKCQTARHYISGKNGRFYRIIMIMVHLLLMCIEWKKNYYLLNFFLDNGLKKTTTTTFIFFGWSFSSTGKTDVNICTNKYYYVTYIYTNHHLFSARITDDDSYQQSSFGSGTFGILQICQLFAKYVNEHGTNDHKYIKCTWLLVSSHGPDHLCKESL